jgi:hypothetical protein
LDLLPLWEQGAAGSNPAAPTNKIKNLRANWQIH